MTHAGGPLLAECLASLHRQTRQPDEVLVVVSNTVKEVPAPTLQLGENVGYARAANAGAAATSGEILLLNDDTRLDPDCVAALERAWTGDGVYQPRIRLADGTGRLDNVGHGFFPDGFVWARGRNGADVPLRGQPGGFSGAAVLVARRVWNAIGGFDERFGSFSEDVDASLRLMRRGVSVTAVPDALVSHHLGATWGRRSPEKLRLIERNRIRAAVRSLPAAAVVTMPIWTAGRLALLGALALSGRGPGAEVSSESKRAALRGIAEGVFDIPAALRLRAQDRPHWKRGELAMWRALWNGRARLSDVIR